VAATPPRIAQIQIAVDVNLVDIHEDHVAAAYFGEEFAQPLNVRDPLLGGGLAQQLLDLPPRQLRLPQEAVEAAAADVPVEKPAASTA